MTVAGPRRRARVADREVASLGVGSRSVSRPPDRSDRAHATTSSSSVSTMTCCRSAARSSRSSSAGLADDGSSRAGRRGSPGSSHRPDRAGGAAPGGRASPRSPRRSRRVGRAAGASGAWRSVLARAGSRCGAPTPSRRGSRRPSPATRAGRRPVVLGRTTSDLRRMSSVISWLTRWRVYVRYDDLPDASSASCSRARASSIRRQVRNEKAAVPRLPASAANAAAGPTTAARGTADIDRLAATRNEVRRVRSCSAWAASSSRCRRSISPMVSVSSSEDPAAAASAASRSSLVYLPGHVPGAGRARRGGDPMVVVRPGPEVGGGDRMWGVGPPVDRGPTA